MESGFWEGFEKEAGLDKDYATHVAKSVKSQNMNNEYLLSEYAQNPGVNKKQLASLGRELRSLGPEHLDEATFNRLKAWNKSQRKKK